MQAIAASPTPAATRWVTPAFVALCIIVSLPCAAWAWSAPAPTAAPALTAMLLACVLSGFTIAEGLAAQWRARQCMWSNPDALTQHAAPWPGFDAACGAAAALVLICQALHLFWHRAFLWGGPAFSALVAAVGTLATSASLFFLVTRRWSPLRGALACALLTTGVAGLFTIPAASDAAAHPLPYAAFLLLGWVAATCAWSWVAGVWQQQLNGSTAWTTAGRLHGLLPAIFWGCAVTAVLIALPLSMLLRTAGRYAEFGTGALVAAALAHLLLIAVLRSAGRRWNRRLGFSLAALTTVSLAVLGLARFGS